MNNTRCETLHQTAGVATGSAGVWTELRRLPGKLAETILVWQERAAERAHLAALDDRLLKDIGLSRADVERETSIPFWRS